MPVKEAQDNEALAGPGVNPHHATYPSVPAAIYQDDEPQENSAICARVQHRKPPHPPGVAAQLVSDGP